jgi:uncharacterized protein (DUF58 family)
MMASAWEGPSEDFCPWANRYVYWLKQPIGWFLVAAAASLLIGLFLAPQGLVMFGIIASVVLLGVAWPWIGTRGLVCRLAFDRQRGREGEPIGVVVTVVNRWPWPAWGLMVEESFFSHGESEDWVSERGNRPAIALARIPGWSNTTFRFDFRPDRRGVYPTAPPGLATGFPFGLWRARRPIVIENEILVWPETVKLTSSPPVSGRQSTAVGSPIDRAGDDGDSIGARPFREGDSLRLVNWAQTARHDRLILRERQANAHRSVRLTIDLYQRHHSISSAESLEWAIRVGASLCQEFHAHHFRVECVFGDRRLSVASPSGLSRLFDELARWSPDRSDSLALPAAAPGKASEALEVVVTTDRGAERFRENRVERTNTRYRQKRATDPLLVILEATGVGGADRRGDAWMRLETKSDIRQQLQHQWERLCHDTWRAA